MLASGDTYEAGSTGGEAEHTLTVEELAKHSHPILCNQPDLPEEYTSTSGSYGANVTWRGAGDANKYLSYGYLSNIVGGNKPHNNMPPYLSVYCWERIA